MGLACAVLLVLVAAVWVPRRGRAHVRPTAAGRWQPRRPRLDAWWRARRAGRRGTVELGVLVTEVASRLRAGESSRQAWRLTLARHGMSDDRGADLDGVPRVLRDLDVGRDTAGAQRLALAATLAACRLSHEVGAPLAQVLDRCAEGITEAAHARDARRVAMAGPRATARVLAWLPLVGLALGAAIGARPLDVLLDGSWGSAALLAGLGLVVVGRRWSTLLLRHAQPDVSRRVGRGAGHRGRRPRGADPEKP